MAMEEVQRRMEQGQMENNEDEKKKTKKKTPQGKSKKAVTSNGALWEVGMPCQAVYTEDGEFYEAIIESLSLEDETCVVKFLGFNNTQNMALENLFKSQGKAAVRRQIEQAQLALESEAQAAAMEWSSHAPEVTKAVPETKMKVKNEQPKRHQASASYPQPSYPMDPSFQMNIPPPPPISQFTAHLPADEAEALSSMCMSWYLNGFHTGYYLGLKQGQKPQ
ncbi:survival motor neuron protein isoform X3 [Neocloeon triangulifer]|nr:survival motor neuron protein isoform X3 [Neocloeon triangulifer]